MKAPTATPRMSGALEISQYKVEPHSGQKWYVAPIASQRVAGLLSSLGTVHVADRPSTFTWSTGSRACTLKALPVRLWQS